MGYVSEVSVDPRLGGTYGNVAIRRRGGSRHDVEVDVHVGRGEGLESVGLLSSQRFRDGHVRGRGLLGAAACDGLDARRRQGAEQQVLGEHGGGTDKKRVADGIGTLFKSVQAAQDGIPRTTVYREAKSKLYILPRTIAGPYRWATFILEYACATRSMPLTQMPFPGHRRARVREDVRRQGAARRPARFGDGGGKAASGAPPMAASRLRKEEGQDPQRF